MSQYDKPFIGVVNQAIETIRVDAPERWLSAQAGSGKPVPDYGCSQEDHIPNCGHFGFSGTYLSDHAPECPAATWDALCECNPKARKASGKKFTHPWLTRAKPND